MMAQKRLYELLFLTNNSKKYIAINEKKAECKSKKGVALTGQASIEIHSDNKNAYSVLISNFLKILKEKIVIIMLKTDP